MHQNLIGLANYDSPQTWLEIRKTEVKFRQILQWVSCFALAVNEVNAALGRGLQHQLMEAQELFLPF
jgi:L-serine dehydratase